MRISTPYHVETGEIASAIAIFRRIMRRQIAQNCCVFAACWIWPGPFNDSGYGELRTPKGKRFGAHWLSYRNFKGILPIGTEVCHSCHFRPCWNPAHLAAGTHLENMRAINAHGSVQTHTNGL